jgi:hypothetical protein
LKISESYQDSEDLNGQDLRDKREIQRDELAFDTFPLKKVGGGRECKINPKKYTTKEENGKYEKRV